MSRLLEEIETEENLIEWLAFMKLEPFGWQMWAMFFGRICEHICVAMGVAARIPITVRPWHYFFRPPYGFVNETDEEREIRLTSYSKTAEELEAEALTDDDMAASARARAEAFRESQEAKKQKG